jgi:hypothetical protein
MVAISICLALAGCASKQYVNGYRAGPGEYNAAVASAPPSPPRIPPACEVRSADLNFATISCRYYGSPSSTDWQEGVLQEMTLAAQTAVLAGKVAIASVERGTPEVHMGYYTYPRACTRTVNGLRLFGAALAGMGGAYQDRAHCNSYGRSTDCTFTPALPPPDVRDTTCVGGETTTYLSGVSTVGTWRFLTANDAESPAMALLPRDKQPFSCAQILAPLPTAPREPPSEAHQKPPRSVEKDDYLAPNPFADPLKAAPTKPESPADPFAE